MRFRISQSGSTIEAISTSLLVDDGLDHYIQCFYDGSNIRIIIDGIVEDTVARTGVIETPTTANFNIGAWSDDLSRSPDARIQELTIATDNYTLTKLESEYLNQSDPDNFATIGEYAAFGGGSTSIPVIMNSYRQRRIN